MSFTSSFENTNVVPDPKILFWIPASVAEAAHVTPNGTKMLLAYSVKTFFINGKLAVINGLRKLRNSHFWLITFLIVPFNKYRLFSKDLITFMIPFISLYVSVIPIIADITFLPSALNPDLGATFPIFFPIIFQSASSLGTKRLTHPPNLRQLNFWKFYISSWTNWRNFTYFWNLS